MHPQLFLHTPVVGLLTNDGKIISKSVNAELITEQPVGFSKQESIILFSLHGDFSANERIIKSRYSIALEAFFHKQSETRTSRTMANFAFGMELIKDINELE